MKVAAVELPDGLEPESSEFSELREALEHEPVDVLVLNELPFGRWPAYRRAYDPEIAAAVEQASAAGAAALKTLAARVIVMTRARAGSTRLINEALCLSDGQTVVLGQKLKFPQEPGFYERTWFEAPDHSKHLHQADKHSIGALVCTELMFNELARQLGNQGASIIAVPRATGEIEKWLIAARMAAITSGCFIVSSNRVGVGSDGQSFGGKGFIIAPSGEVIGSTSAAASLIVANVDLDSVLKAQADYPCYLFN